MASKVYPVGAKVAFYYPYPRSITHQKDPSPRRMIGEVTKPHDPSTGRYTVCTDDPYMEFWPKHEDLELA